jgi:uncharacterized protein YbjT (DUF2867 family)
MDAPKLNVLAIGATGSIGRHVVEEALCAGHRVRALVRDTANHLLPADVEIVAGDLTRPASLPLAVEGIDAVVFTHGTYGSVSAAEAVDYGGVRNVLAALGGRKVRIALMTAIAVTDRKGAHDWKRRAERLVRASGLPYTIVRPSWFDHNSPRQLRLIALQGDARQSGTPRDGVVARHQVAKVLVRSLTSGAAARKTFELVAETGPETQDFDSLFATADADDLNAIDGVHDASNMPLDGESSQVLAELASIKTLCATV